MMTTASPRKERRTITIVVVEDHKIVRGGLRLLLESRVTMSLVGEVGSAEEARDLIAREKPDVVLLDLDLNGESGLDLLPEIPTLSETSRALVLTGTRDLALRHQCVRLGARGLVQKEAAADVLIKAIECVHAGEIWFDRSLMSNVLNDVLHSQTKRADPETESVATLTPREREVVLLVCEGLRNKQIADRLFISNTTVRHHLTSIFSKLGISDRLGLVIFAYRNDLMAPIRNSH